MIKWPIILFIWSTSTFDVAAHLAGRPTGPPGKCQTAHSAPAADDWLMSLCDACDMKRSSKRHCCQVVRSCQRSYRHCHAVLWARSLSGETCNICCHSPADLLLYEVSCSIRVILMLFLWLRFYGFCHFWCILINFLENGRLSDRYRIGTDTGRIVSIRIGYCCIGRYIAAGSAAVNRLHYTGDQRAVATCHSLRANTVDRPWYRSLNAHCNTAAVN